MFWVFMAVYWFILCQCAMPSAIVLGMGLLFAVVAGFLGWNGNACKILVGFFFALSMAQFFTNRPIMACLYTPFDKVYYTTSMKDDFILRGLDRDYALDPHQAPYDWLKRVEPAEATSMVENAYREYLESKGYEDTEINYNKFIKKHKKFTPYIENTGSFSMQAQKGFVYRHMKYHRCTWEQLLVEGKATRQKYIDYICSGKEHQEDADQQEEITVDMIENTYNPTFIRLYNEQQARKGLPPYKPNKRDINYMSWTGDYSGLGEKDEDEDE